MDQSEAIRLVGKLTQRERQSLSHLASGLTVKESAVNCSPLTEKGRRSLVYAKLGVSTIAQASVIAARAGVV